MQTQGPDIVRCGGTGNWEEVCVHACVCVCRGGSGAVHKGLLCQLTFGIQTRLEPAPQTGANGPMAILIIQVSEVGGGSCGPAVTWEEGRRKAWLPRVWRSWVWGSLTISPLTAHDNPPNL
jgi:hypothetical protein